jgi:hypothetical protein
LLVSKVYFDLCYILFDIEMCVTINYLALHQLFMLFFVTSSVM